MHFSSPEHRVLREGTSFTVLEQSKDHAHAALIFQNGYHPSGFQFKADMNPIQIEQKHSFNLSYAHNQRPAR